MDGDRRRGPAESVDPGGAERASEIVHLAGPSAEIRQVVAAHFLRDCPHILEIGGHLRPITGYLTHHPLSVTSVDPKTAPFEADSLNGRPCRVRHLARKFQDVAFDLPAFGYGLVMIGFSLKPFGRREPVGELLLSLVDRARRVVIEYAPALERATSQVPALLTRPGLVERCRLDLTLHDPAIAASPYAARRLHVLVHAGEA